MKSSKKVVTRVLVAALALSMVAGTGIGAAAVDTVDTDYEIVDTVDMGEDIAEPDVDEGQTPNAIKGLISNLISNRRLPKILSDEIKAELVQKVREISKDSLNAAKNVLSLVKSYRANADKFAVEEDGVYFEADDFKFKVHASLVDGLTAEVVGYMGDSESFTIPDEVNGLTITAIGNIAENTNGEILGLVNEITIPQTITSIDVKAMSAFSAVESFYVYSSNPSFMDINGVVFDKMGKKLVLFPSARTEYDLPKYTAAIGDYAFCGSQIQKLNISEPQSELEILSSVGAYAFADCVGLEEINIDCAGKVGKGAFAGCENLKTVYVSSDLTEIGEGAFEGVSEDFVIEGYNANCYAAEYAQENGINYHSPLEVDIDFEFEGDFFGSVALGSTFHIIGNAGGGEGDYLYAFLYKRPGEEKWTVKQGFKENNVIEFTPAYTGNYEFCVKVKDASGEIAKMFSDIQVEEAFVNESSISSDTISKGEIVTVTAVPEEGMENCTYAFYYKKTTDTKWTQKQGFDTNNTVAIKPAKVADYQICVKIKDENGSIAKKYFDLKVNPAE